MIVPTMITLSLVAQCVLSATIQSSTEPNFAPLPALKSDAHDEKFDSPYGKPHNVWQHRTTENFMKIEANDGAMNAQRISTTSSTLENHGQDATSTTTKIGHGRLTSEGVKDLKLHEHWNRKQGDASKPEIPAEVPEHSPKTSHI